ncbi:M23 family metallopeptidase [Streptomyces echinoruber]|uniref:Peptidase n=1 Tax=Streptomyces echinoruber TaxID=68898 RepID=A0A918RCE7_9ACTN|nr:M23 family metallopeptidase [Streptomyces echinoruber]GGZ90324.1 peptidase [Streptomyces echinoruber]
MDDRHPSGTATTPAPASQDASAHYAPYGGQGAAYGDFTTYGGYDATAFPAQSTAAGHTGTGYTADPLSADPLSGDPTGTGAASYGTGQWCTDTTHHPLAHDAYAAHHHAAYDTTSWTATGTGQWDTQAWLQPEQTGADHTQQWDWGTVAFDTGAYDATQWNTAGAGEHPAGHPAEPFGQQATATFAQVPDPHATAAFEPVPDATAAFEQVSYDAQAATGEDGYQGEDGYGYGDENGDGDEDGGESAATGELPAVAPLLDDQEEVTVPPAPGARAASRAAGRSRRRTPPKRSALLTVAVPSVCVMGVAGIAAASVGTLSDDGKETSAAASDAQTVQPSTANNKLDTQLASLSAGADDFADRASRTQERIDLKAQQEAEKRKAAEEAARRERLRPKFALPVAQHGLSAYFGQAGINWMSVHTGIDFPVSYGTTVMAATDGTVRTQWNSAYGNMMIVTAKDGTETWYCHLSTYIVPSGTTVKAGQPIAHSGNSGNSTGPHLHFEVRPGGGAPIDPLPWLRSHDLDPS